MCNLVGQMKRLPILALSSVALTVVSCDFNQPLPGNDAYNPLNVPGAGAPLGIADSSGSSYSAGSFLQTTSSMTAFYSSFPKGAEQPTKTLANYTDVKVISTKGSYVKVEVVNTGDVGYVPSVMLGEKRSPNEVPVTAAPGEIPVTPGIAPEPAVPDIQPPEVGDPSRPSE
jgi:hypothetical protein